MEGPKCVGPTLGGFSQPDPLGDLKRKQREESERREVEREKQKELEERKRVLDLAFHVDEDD
jgi:hypothetical protein